MLASRFGSFSAVAQPSSCFPAGPGCKILDQEEVKPHKVRYYLEQRDPEFAEKLAEVLCVLTYKLDKAA